MTSSRSALPDTVRAWYDGAARDLPWRAPGVGAWPVLVSEVMLQQTPVDRVLPAWTAWLERWPTPAALAADSPGEAVRMWGKLGYPRRALRLVACARAIVERHGGVVPSDVAELERLPGIGAYTARAVAVFAYGRRHPVVDTNVRRVVARAVEGSGEAGPPSARRDHAAVEALLPGDPGEAAVVSIALMELGALVCTARAPRCERCPPPGCAPGGWRARRPTPGRPPVRSASPAPTGRSAGCCWTCCAARTGRCPRPRSTWSGRTACSASGRWTAWSPTAWSIPATTAGTRCPPDASARARGPTTRAPARCRVINALLRLPGATTRR